MKKWIFVAAVLIVVVLSVIFMTEAIADSRFICCVHKGEWVWVRSGPSKDSEKIDTIRYGVEVDVSEIVNQYAHIKWLDKEGWADVSYFEMPIKEEIWVVNTKDPLNKRETPDGRYLTKIKGGSRISILAWRYSSSGELWAKTYHGGYVNAKYLSKE